MSDIPFEIPEPIFRYANSIFKGRVIKTSLQRRFLIQRHEWRDIPVEEIEVDLGVSEADIEVSLTRPPEGVTVFGRVTEKYPKPVWMSHESETVRVGEEIFSKPVSKKEGV